MSTRPTTNPTEVSNAHGLVTRPAWNHFVRRHVLDKNGVDYLIDMRTRWWWEVLSWFGMRLTPGRYRIYISTSDHWLEVPPSLLTHDTSNHLARMFLLRSFTDVVTFLRHWEREYASYE